MTGDDPALVVAAGHPSADELAALTVALSAVLAARDRATAPGRAGRTASGWANRSGMLGAPLTPGPDAWRRSGRPG
jgi:acyl-CoA carboxylase epsilon subunit